MFQFIILKRPSHPIITFLRTDLITKYQHNHTGKRNSITITIFVSFCVSMYKPDDPYTLTYQTNYFKYLLWALQLLLSCCLQLITYCQDTTYVHRLSQSNTFVWVRNTAYVRLWTKLNVAKHVTEFCVWWQILFQQLMLPKITGLLILIPYLNDTHIKNHFFDEISLDIYKSN